MTELKLERIGEVSQNSFGSKMELIEYRGTKDITVKFENGYTTNSAYDEFIRGSITNPYDKTICGVGFLGEGKYTTKNRYIHTNQYSVWRGIIQRCYDENQRKRYPSYLGCTVDSKWFNFQVFAKWYDKNYYEILGEQMQVDKDILFKHNKIYSPKTCIIAPSRINSLFTKRDASRGLYPIGVSFEHRPGRKYKFKAGCRSISNKKVDLGRFNTQEEAFNTYKEYKENVIKEVADNYKESIPKKLYAAMYNYKVEITD